MSEQATNRIKDAWKLIVGTVIVCAAIFGFIYKHMVDLKNEQIALLERQNKQLSEVGAVPEAVKNLQTGIETLARQLAPLLAVTSVDPLTGRAKFGGMDSPTDLSRDMTVAMDLVTEKKYDLALQKADDMRKRYPDFVGADYIYFLVNKSKGFSDEMVKYGQTIIEKLPDDERMAEIYVTIINYYLSSGRKRKAEDLAVQALRLLPKDQALKDSFKKVFGYLPSFEQKAQ